jgi:hypothetical protein
MDKDAAKVKAAGDQNEQDDGRDDKRLLSAPGGLDDLLRFFNL